MHLNTLSPSKGSRPKGRRLGRGIGSSTGKTAGRGHKGQKARAGGYHKVGFEGGQMPLQRRLPKVGFVSKRKALRAQVTLSQLNAIGARDTIDPTVLLSAGLVGRKATKIKVIRKGQLNFIPTLKAVSASKGALESIAAAGGRVEA